MLINNKINKHIPLCSKRIDKVFFIVKGLGKKDRYGVKCDYCGVTEGCYPTYMIRKSKSTWICLCNSCLTSLVNSATILKRVLFYKRYEL